MPDRNFSGAVVSQQHKPCAEFGLFPQLAVLKRDRRAIKRFAWGRAATMPGWIHVDQSAVAQVANVKVIARVSASINGFSQRFTARKVFRSRRCYRRQVLMSEMARTHCCDSGRGHSLLPEITRPMLRSFRITRHALPHTSEGVRERRSPAIHRPPQEEPGPPRSN